MHDGRSAARLKTAIALLALVCAAQACNDTQEAPPATGEQVFDPMLETLDDAREVDDLARARRETLDQALEPEQGAGKP